MRLKFAEAPLLGKNGRIEVFRTSDGSRVDVLDLVEDEHFSVFGGKRLRYAPVSVQDRSATIQLRSGVLAPRETYCVNIDPGVFTSATGKPFAGVTTNDWRFTTRDALPGGRARLVVAADSTGDFCTIQGAVDHVRDDNQTPVEVFIRKGTHEGITYIGREKNYIHLIGEDRKTTIISGRNNDRLNRGRNGRPLLCVDANDFVLENLTVHNTTPHGGSQAEALAVSGDRCIMRNASFLSFQDTLLLNGRVYATNCYIEGDVDFIWGRGSAFLDQCEIRAVHSGYYLQSRNDAEHAGYVFFKCRLTAAPGVEQCWLARIEADRFPHSQAAFIECEMGPHIPREGWLTTQTNFSRLRFEEFRSADPQGKPIDISGRHPASRQLDASAAEALANPAWVLACQDRWNPRARPATALAQ